MTVSSFNQLLRFFTIPLAMTSFVLVASQAGGFELRKGPQLKLESRLISPTSPIKYPRS